MAQWLLLELAKAFGIAANIDFPCPRVLSGRCSPPGAGGCARQSPYNKGAMSWQLMTILPALLDRPAFAPLAAYLGGQRWGGAGTGAPLAALPEGGGSVRPVPGLPAGLDRPLGTGEGLGPELAGVSGQDWQPELWRELVARTLALSPSGYHRANLYEEFIHELARSAELPGKAALTGVRVRHLGPAAALRGGPAGPRQPRRGGGAPVRHQPLSLLLGICWTERPWRGWKTGSSPARIRDPAGPRQPTARLHGQAGGATTCIS